MSDEEQLAHDRITLTLDQWPRLTAAWGCANCDVLFKSPSEHGHCPCCGSTSILDIAAILGRDAGDKEAGQSE